MDAQNNKRTIDFSSTLNTTVSLNIDSTNSTFTPQIETNGEDIAFDPVLETTAEADFNGQSGTGITTVIDPQGNVLPKREKIQFVGTGVSSVTVTKDRTVVNIVGLTDYNSLTNKPTLNGTVIQGAMTTSGLGLATVSGLTNGTIVVKTAVNSTNADYALDATHATSADSATSATTAANYNTTSGTIKTAIDDLNTGLAGKASTTTVSALDTRVTTNTNNISTINSTLGTKADSSTVSAIDTRVTQNTTDIGTLNTAVSGKADGLNINSNKLQLKSGDTLIGNVITLPGGGTGSSDYNDLNNKPTLNGVEIVGTQTSSDFGIANVTDITNGTIVAKEATNAVNASNYATGGTIETVLGTKQDKTDNSLTTTAKTVVGAINENKGNIDTLTTGLNGKGDSLAISGTDLSLKSGDTVLSTVAIPSSGDAVWGSITGTLSNQTDLQTALDSKADTDAIPTKTSQLTNDSGYVTSTTAPVTSVNAKIGAVVLTANDVNALPSDTTYVASVDGASGTVVLNDVKYTAQTLTEEQKTQARTNIGAGTSSFGGSYNDLSDKPTIPTKTSELTNDSNFVDQTALDLKQNIADSTLTTTSKTVVGAINEVSGVANEAYSSTNVPPYPVTSVNTKTGDVVLNATDVNALPNTTTYVSSVDGNSGIITTNGVKFVAQTLTDTQKTQARTNIGAGTSNFTGAYSDLSGKPTIPSKTSDLTNDSGYITATQAPVQSVNGQTGAVVLTQDDVGNGATYVRTTNDYTTADKTKLAGIASGAEVNVINTVKQNGTALTITDKAVNVTVPTTASDINAEPAFTKNTAFNKNFETATANIKMDGTVSVGTTSTVARADHIHPTDTTRASVTALNSEISDRQSADTTLQSNIDAKASQADLNAEITNRTNADNELNVQIQNLSYQNQWIGSVATCATGSEQTVLTQYVVDTVSRQPRQGDEVTITDRGEIWLYNSAGTWVYFASTDQIVDATTDNKGVVQIGSGINVSGGVISVTKSLIGLGNVDNTSDANKPVSTAAQSALNLKQNITDSTLNTTAKTVVGAINENKSNIDSNTANIGTINTSLASKYGTDNEPPYPVTSVNSKTGAVTLTASDVSALPASTTYVSSVDGNSGGVTLNDVKYTTQSLTTTQQAQARSNIGAGTSSFSGAYGDLTGTPTIPSKTSDLTNDSGFQTATQVNSAISSATADMATTDTAQTISGAKTFSTVPTVSATIASGDNSTKVGTTAWVTSKLASYATTSDLTTGLAGKQDTLAAGTNIAIANNTISVTGTVPSATKATNVVNGTYAVTAPAKNGVISTADDLTTGLATKGDSLSVSGSDLSLKSGTTTLSTVALPTEKGVPTGGSAGQILAKKSDTSMDTVWKTLDGYTKSEVDTALALKADQSSLDTTNSTVSSNALKTVAISVAVADVVANTDGLSADYPYCYDYLLSGITSDYSAETCPTSDTDYTVWSASTDGSTNTSANKVRIYFTATPTAVVNLTIKYLKAVN